MVIDERFFDPEVEGPETLGNPAASLDFGRVPYKDTSATPSYVRTVAAGRRDPIGAADRVNHFPSSPCATES
jgi:hypothetical protein